MIRYHARWLLPVSAPPIEHGTVAVEDGRIAFVGSRSGAPRGADVDLGDAVLMPGLVNVHTHLELTVMRGFLEDLEFPRWILRLNGVKRAVLDRARMLDSARHGVAEGLLAGVTCYADTCDSGVAFDALIEARVRGIMYQEVFGPDPRTCDESMQGLRAKIRELRARETNLVRAGISPHAPYTVADELYSAAAAFAKDEGLPVAVHIAESETERQLVEQGTGFFADGLRKRGITVAPRARTSIELLDKVGILDRRALLIHCVRLDDRDIGQIARAGCPVAHCPISNAKLGHGAAPLIELLAAGVTVGIGSDSVASNNRVDILAEVRAAILTQRARLARHDALCAGDAIRLATFGGAHALGLEGEIGTLDVGKSADLAAFPLDTCSTPVHDIEAAVVFALPGARASFVCVAGEELVRDGRLRYSDPSLDRRIDETAVLMQRWLADHNAAAASLAPA